MIPIISDTPITTDTGFYWHVHHDILMEWCASYSGRVAAIMAKPAAEINTRLRLFQPVTGELPEKCRMVAAAMTAAREIKGVDVSYRKWQALAALFKAREECASLIVDLHRQQCPNCPWNGRTIFPAAADLDVTQAV